MEDSIKRKLDKFERQSTFFANNAADFPVGTPGGDVAAINAAIVAEMKELAGEQFSGANAVSQTTDDKSAYVGDMMKLLRNINRAANAFEEEIPGTDRMFRLPRNRSESNLLAAAGSFIADAAPLRDTFVEYGLEPDFLTDLQNYIDAIEAAGQRGDTSAEDRAGSTAGLSDAASRGMKNSRRADAIVRIKYAENPQKLAEWTIASHLEREPKRKTNEPQT